MGNRENSLISIVINNYNYGSYLKNAINSALNQTYENIEIIVVDDGSTDGSREIIESYGSSIISVFKENGGQASALNAGLLASTGKIICLLDSDDVFSPFKATEINQAFNLNQAIGWCFHPLVLHSANTLDCFDYKSIEFPEKINNRYIQIDFRESIKKSKLPTFVPPTSGLCFSRTLLEKIFPLPESDGVSISDLYIKYIAIALSRGCLITIPLAIQGLHESNAYTQNKSLSDLRRTFSEIQILTAYFMKINFPFISKLANKLFAKGVAVSLHVNLQNSHVKKMKSCYFGKINIKEKIFLAGIIGFYYLKLFKEDLI